MWDCARADAAESFPESAEELEFGKSVPNFAFFLRSVYVRIQ
jgi:hypothetical protein